MSTVNVTDESPVLHAGVCTLGYSYRYILEDWDWKWPTASIHFCKTHTHSINTFRGVDNSRIRATQGLIL